MFSRVLPVVRRDRLCCVVSMATTSHVPGLGGPVTLPWQQKAQDAGGLVIWRGRGPEALATKQDSRFGEVTLG